jgi:hypothetical protein
MIHVKMGKADVVQLLEFAEGNGVETTFTTVEQQPAHTLPRIHADQQGIVVARSPQDLVLKTHRIGLPFKKWRVISITDIASQRTEASEHVSSIPEKPGSDVIDWEKHRMGGIGSRTRSGSGLVSLGKRRLRAGDGTLRRRRIGGASRVPKDRDWCPAD